MKSRPDTHLNVYLRIGFCLLAGLLVIAACAGLLFPGDPQAMVGPRTLWPLQNAQFPLGTDQLGREVAAQLAHGARVSLIRHADYVLAAETMGIGHLSIVRQHILPNSAAPVIVIISVVIAHAILVEAALAFLGLGDLNTVSWGAMIRNARPLLKTA